jgi:hypothetical protein
MTSDKKYQPTPEDEALLLEHNLNLEQVLAYDTPPQEELDDLGQFGYSLIESILKYSLQNAVRAELNELALIKKVLQRVPFTLDQMATTQEVFLKRVQPLLDQNLYPGKNFSLEKAQSIIAIADATPWTNENFVTIFDQMWAIVVTDEER